MKSVGEYKTKESTGTNRNISFCCHINWEVFTDYLDTRWLNVPVYVDT